MTKTSGEKGGITLTLKNLREKVKVLRLKKNPPQGNEDENVRGFASGGVSEMSEDEKKSLDKEIAMIEKEIAKQQKNLTLADVENVQNGLKDIIENAKENGAKIEENTAEKSEENNSNRHTLSFASSQEAMEAAKAIAGLYESLGLSTSISKSRSGKKGLITVTIEIPHQMAGKSLLGMSAGDILNALQSEKVPTKNDATKEQGDEKNSWVDRVGQNKTGLEVSTGKAYGSWANYVQNRGAEDHTPGRS